MKLQLLRKQPPRCDAIVVAAGESRRMGGVDKLTAPLSEGQVVGSVRVMLGERVLREIEAVVDRDVRVRGVGEGIMRVLRLWVYL